MSLDNYLNLENKNNVSGISKKIGSFVEHGYSDLRKSWYYASEDLKCYLKGAYVTLRYVKQDWSDYVSLFVGGAFGAIGYAVWSKAPHLFSIIGGLASLTFFGMEFCDFYGKNSKYFKERKNDMKTKMAAARLNAKSRMIEPMLKKEGFYSDYHELWERLEQFSSDDLEVKKAVIGQYCDSLNEIIEREKKSETELNAELGRFFKGLKKAVTTNIRDFMKSMRCEQ